jgi:chromate transporter
VKLAKVIEVFYAFLRLGLTSFGGPVAHLGYYHNEFVVRRKWVTEREYADLVALCQFLPGPASAQTAFCIGVKRAGQLGGLASWVAFTTPSAIIMIVFAYGLFLLGDSGAGLPGWLKGLKIAAAAVVAHAVWGMAKRLCPDKFRAAMSIGAACFVLAWASPFAQVSALAVGGLVGYFFIKSESEPVVDEEQGMSVKGAVFYLSCFFILLAGLPLAASFYNSELLAIADSYYRTGSLVFGGGHAVLPLLQAEVVNTGKVTAEQFMAGYGAAQAIPGPVFTFAAYLGVISNGLAGGLVALFAIFMPSYFLVSGVLPFWHKLRSMPAARNILAGTNAAVVGLLMAVLYDPVFLAGITSHTDLIIAMIVFGLLQFARFPSWAAVIFAALAGQVLL